MKLNSPSTIILPEVNEKVRRELTYTDRSVMFQVKKLKEKFYWQKSDPEGFQQRLDELKASAKKCLIFQDEDGNYCTYSGLRYDLNNVFGWNLESPQSLPQPARMIPWNHPPARQLRYYQKEAVDALLSNASNGPCAIELPTGCHSKGTLILMYNGSLKKVEDIKIGDIIMGPDSKPRHVLSLHRGFQEMAEIQPIKGEPFTVNMDHILSLQRTNINSDYRTVSKKRYPQFRGENPIINISVKDYLKTSKTFKHLHKLYRVGIDFNKKTTKFKIPPYILGLWLGDGHSSKAALTTMDNEIRLEWLEWVKSCGMDISITKQPFNKASIYSAVLPKHIHRSSVKRNNICNKYLDNLTLLNNKHIPEKYKTASRQCRLELLAGIMDTDGYNAGGYFDYISKSQRLATDVVFLARSLGFGVTIRLCKKTCQTGVEGTYYRVFITGDVSIIPVKLSRKKTPTRKQIKNPLRTGFKIIPKAKGEYFGFEVDKDNLYVMGDFTVTHNSGKTPIIFELCKTNPLQTVIMTPSKNITNQIYEEMVHLFGKKFVGKYGAGKKELGKLFTVVTGQALTNLEQGSDEWDFFSKTDQFISDESHTVPCETFEKVCLGVLKFAPYRFFVSATQMRTDGAELLLRGITGPVVYRKDFKELVKEGYLAEPFFKIFHVPTYGYAGNRDVNKETKSQLYLNPNVNKLAAEFAYKAVTLTNRPTIILIEEFQQFIALKNYLTIPFEFAHGGSSNRENADGTKLKDILPQEYWNPDVEAMVERFNSGKTKLLIGTSAITTGVDFRPTGCIINLQGGLSEINIKQGLGRGTRLVPGKTDVIYVDFKVIGSPSMERHADERIGIYKTLGDVQEFNGR